MKHITIRASLITFLLLSTLCSTTTAIAQFPSEPQVSAEITSEVHKEAFGDIWWKNFWFDLRRFDRKNKTDYYQTAKPQIITGKQAYKLLRGGKKTPIFNNSKIDKLVLDTSKRDGSIALYWEFPKVKGHPEALLYMPFFKEDHDIFTAVGIGDFVGTISISNLQPENTSTSKEKAPRYSKPLPDKRPDTYVLLLHVPACANTPQVSATVDHVFTSNATTKIPVYTDLVRNHSHLFPEYAPLEGGPLLVLIKNGQVHDLQYGAPKTYQIEHLLIRNGLMKKTPMLSKAWHKIEDRDTLLRTMNIQQNHVATDFRGLDLRDATFDKTVISGSNFEGQDLRNVSFRGAYIYGSTFKGVTLEAQNFEGALWINSTCPDGSKSNPKTKQCF